MPRDYSSESLSHDPIHGYIAFTSRSGLPEVEDTYLEVVDHPLVHRLLDIYKL